MKKKVFRTIALLIGLSIMTGCWNLREPDHLALNLGSGLDANADGDVEYSAQIAIPSGAGGGNDGGGGAGKKSFRVMSSGGITVYDAIQKLQTKLSREIFFGHRKVILIGESMAYLGFQELLDEYIRNPRSEMRSLILVVKDGKAKDLLSEMPIFDNFNTAALKRQERIIEQKKYYFRDFLYELLAQGVHPMIPAVCQSTKSDPYFCGYALINKNEGVKLKGFLNSDDSPYAGWIANKQTGSTITAFSNTHTKKTAMTMKLQFLQRDIRTKIAGNRIHVQVRLSGKGSLVENNTDLDPTRSEDLKLIEAEFNKRVQTEALRIIKKVQENEKLDVFGFGYHVHMQHPRQWREIKKKWDSVFPTLSVSVIAKVECYHPGQTNSSINKFSR